MTHRTDPWGAAARLSESPPPPDGRPLLVADSYAEAACALGVLAGAGFPVRHVALVRRRTGGTDSYALTLTGGERAQALRVLHEAGLA